MEEQRRRNPRLEIPLDVECIVEGSEEPRRGRIHDLSAGGAALLLPEDIPPKSHFTSVRFLLPAERSFPFLMIDTPAVAAHSKPEQDADGETCCRVGIRFEGLPEENRRRIEQFVDLRLMREETPPALPLGKRRVPFEQPISVRFDLFNSFVTEVSANISETGMFLTKIEPKSPGSVFEFQFTLGDDFTLIEGQAEVVWVRHQSAEPDKPSGMGVHFRRLADDSRAVIRTLVNRHIAAGHAPFDLEEAAVSAEVPVEEISVSGAPQEPAGTAAGDGKAALEEPADGGGAVGAGEALSHEQAEPPGDRDALRAEVWSLLRERKKLEGRLRAAAAGLSSVQEEFRTREADLRDQLASRRALRDAGLLAAGVLMGTVGLFYFYSLRLAPGWVGALGGESAGRPAEEPQPQAAVVSELAPMAEPVAPSEEPDAASSRAVVRAWAAAWSGQRADDYLSFYARDFEPPDGLARSEWEELRRQRLERPSWIKVTLGPLEQETLKPGHTWISFNQVYETATYRDRVPKTLELVWEDGTWKILRERGHS